MDFKHDKYVNELMVKFLEIGNLLFYSVKESFSRLDIVGLGADDRVTTRVDKMCEDIIINQLRKLSFPWFGISEEAGEIFNNNQKSNNIFSFLIDPLDATHNAVIDFPFYSSSIAVFKNGELYIGWVFDISRNITYFALRNFGAFVKKGDKFTPINVNKTVNISEAVIGLIRPKSKEEYLSWMDILLRVNKYRCVSCSSLEICYVASGIYDSFIDLSKKGWQKDCDIAAALLILSEAGGFFSDLDGGKFLIKEPSIHSLKTRRSLITACTEELAKEIISTLKMNKGG